MGKLDGKVAVLTASTNGIGLAMAKHLGLAGASVVISSRKEDNVKSAVQKLKNLGVVNVIGVVCHVAKNEDRTALLSAAIKTYHRIDILILNAAVNPVFHLTTLTGFSYGPYSVSKTALLALTKVFAEELAPNNITVNCIAPGLISTNFSKVISTFEHMKFSLLKRAGTPDEVGALALFLCSEDAGYITGETIVISGGMTSRL